MENLLRLVEKIIPKTIYKWGQPIYHFKMALLSAVLYSFPSRKIKVIAVTGTKGKSSTTEILNSILEKAGYKTAVSNTIRFKVGDESTDNLYKMSMPGRFFIQRFLKKAVDAKCDFVIMEITSQGSAQYRHKFIDLDALIFTNLSPEHIDYHGSYENYIEAKVDIARQLSKSKKKPRIMVVNRDDVESKRFLAIPVDIQRTFGISDTVPKTPLLGEFNKYNVLGAVTLAGVLGIDDNIIDQAVLDFKEIPGRVQFVKCGQDFDVIVDYAHTIESLEKLYKTFPDTRKICVLGGTGGGRDTWKRKEMGKIADTYCDEIILTDEDPYDEDPNKIVADVAQGISHKTPKIIMDRREAIHEALALAKTGDIVLITGKGTDPYIMGPHNTKIPWDDAQVAEEELGKIKSSL